MPTQTFFNLPESKKKTILMAARQEFSRVPLEQASIANIIKEAGIPRGSFYQYFENKEDLFLYITKQMCKKIVVKMGTFLEENNGDIIEAFVKSFHFSIHFISKEENENFFKNLFMSMSDKMKDNLTLVPEHNHHSQGMKQFHDLINKSLLDVKNEKELTYLLKMLKGVFSQNIAHYFMGRMSEEETIETYLFQMNLIKKAIYRKEAGENE